MAFFWGGLGWGGVVGVLGEMGKEAAVEGWLPER